MSATRKPTPLLLLLLPLALLGGGRLAAEPAPARPGYRVVVNSENPVRSLAREEASRLFLKKVSRWPGDVAVMPVDLAEGSAVRAQFSEDVHRRSTRAIKSYWQQMIFSGRAAPPPEVESDAQVIAYVREHPGAIGYVSAETALEGVETVAIAGEGRRDERPAVAPTPRGATR